mmetsp:Transcript_6154/g.11606  ORF Transcript_6154/g.11606 Transcript_6154/m.11606 type:complete len:234 (-) Transcript_6154:320-1021(-)
MIPSERRSCRSRTMISNSSSATLRTPKSATSQMRPLPTPRRPFSCLSSSCSGLMSLRAVLAASVSTTRACVTRSSTSVSFPKLFLPSSCATLSRSTSSVPAQFASSTGFLQCRSRLSSSSTTRSASTSSGVVLLRAARKRSTSWKSTPTTKEQEQQHSELRLMCDVPHLFRWGEWVTIRSHIYKIAYLGVEEEVRKYNGRWTRIVSPLKFHGWRPRIIRDCVAARLRTHCCSE